MAIWDLTSKNFIVGEMMFFEINLLYSDYRYLGESMIALIIAWTSNMH